MRLVKITEGPNLGFINIGQDYLFRGDSYNKFKEQVERNKGVYCGSNDDYYGPSTFVAINIEGCVSYCNPHLELILKHEGVKDIKDIKMFDSCFEYVNAGKNTVKVENRPLLLAIRHEPYELIPPFDEGLVIPGLISLDDIVLVTTEQILLQVCHSFHSLDEKTQKSVKLRAGILD